LDEGFWASFYACLRPAWDTAMGTVLCEDKGLIVLLFRLGGGLCISPVTLCTGRGGCPPIEQGEALICGLGVQIVAIAELVLEISPEEAETIMICAT
jgi:hypothetical protein